MKRNAVAWAALVVSTAALVSSRGLTRPVPAVPRMPVESQRTARSLSDAFVSVADFVRPSVVQISVQRKVSNTLRMPGGQGQGRMNPFQVPPGSEKDMNDMLRELLKRRFNAPDSPDGGPEQQQFGGGGVAHGTGSGFVYDDKGHILTNNHVVNGAGEIKVTFHDGVEASAKVVGTDPKSDVAVIKVDNTSYTPLPRGSSGKLRVGELVMAVGSPFGLSQSVTMGIVSATERNDLGINGNGDTYESFIQTDAPINPGNSGGPMLDMDGRVVGINSAIMTRGSGGNDGVGFAIPIDMASNIADKLIKDGKVNRARIGVAIGPMTPAAAKLLGVDPKTKGLMVQQVVSGSPADKAGLKQGDVIVSFNHEPIANVHAFRMNVAACDIGKAYGLAYFRDGKEHSTEVVLGSSEKVVFDQEKENEETHEPEAKVEPAKTAIDDFGLEVQPLTADLAKGLGMKNTEGVLISSVKEGSPAEAAGLKPGLVITQVVKDRKFQNLKDVKAFKDLAGKADDLMVYVKSNDSTGAYVTLSKAKPH